MAAVLIETLAAPIAFVVVAALGLYGWLRWLALQTTPDYREQLSKMIDEEAHSLASRIDRLQMALTAVEGALSKYGIGETFKR